MTEVNVNVQTQVVHLHVRMLQAGPQGADGVQIDDSNVATTTTYSSTKIAALLANKSDVGHTHTASQITDFSEAVDDRVNALLVAGSNITLVYDDTLNTLTISSAGGGTVSSVFGRTGAVVATSGDYTTAQVTESGNLYFTDTRARATVAGISSNTQVLFNDGGVMAGHTGLTYDKTSTQLSLVDGNEGIAFSPLGFFMSGNVSFFLITSSTPLFNFIKFTGDISAPGQVAAGNQMFALNASGYDNVGNAGNTVVSIEMYAKENFTATAQGTYLSFYTTPTSSITPAERVRIENDGQVIIYQSLKIGTLTGLLKSASGAVSAAVAGTDYESPLTFSTGLTRTTNTITNNLSVGVSGGQTATGGTGSGDSLTLSSTSHATKGKLLFGTSAYDEVNDRLGIGTAAPSVALDVRGSLIVNEAGGDFDTRIEGDTNVNLLFIDASTDRVGIGLNGPEQLLHVNGVGMFQANATNVQSPVKIQNRSTGSAANGVGINFSFFDTSGTETQLVVVRLEKEQVWTSTASTKDAKLVLAAIENNARVDALTLYSNEYVFNEVGGNYDTRIEGDTDTALFFVDASVDRIGVGTNTPGYKLDVVGDINIPSANAYNVNGVPGVSGTFLTADAKTVTVTKGIITNIV